MSWSQRMYSSLLRKSTSSTWKVEWQIRFCLLISVSFLSTSRSWPLLEKTCAISMVFPGLKSQIWRSCTSTIPSIASNSFLMSFSLMYSGVDYMMMWQQFLVMGQVDRITMMEKMQVEMGSSKCQLLNSFTVWPMFDPTKKMIKAEISKPMLWITSAGVKRCCTQSVEYCCFHAYALVLVSMSMSMSMSMAMVVIMIVPVIMIVVMPVVIMPLMTVTMTLLAGTLLLVFRVLQLIIGAMQLVIRALSLVIGTLLLVIGAMQLVIGVLLLVIGALSLMARTKVDSRGPEGIPADVLVDDLVGAAHVLQIVSSSDYLVALNLDLIFVPMDLRIPMAVLNILVIDQALNILTHYLIAHLLFVFNWELLSTALRHQTMGVGSSRVQDEVHYNVDWQSSSRHNEHGQGLFHELPVNDAFSGLIEQKQGQCPDDEQVAQGSQQLHSMISKGHLAGVLLSGEPDKQK